nr:PREDICTED: band 4.1-like protein 4B [Latimeria chalumnae]|eukprot:XP_006007662.2 PREDICTED: band 4.1-like protein 4B [Latimeria chalumnae]
MMRFLRRTFGRSSMRRYADERDGGGGGRPRRDADFRAVAASATAHSSALPPPPVVSGGATVHIPAAGKSKSVLPCRVLLLDGTDVSVELPKNAKGQDLFDQIVYHLELVEVDYFGLQFMDAAQITHWMDFTKPIRKQVKIGPPYTLHFRIKYFSSEPNNLHEEFTRYLFVLQLRQDILSGKLKCPHDVAVDLAAFCLQAELGDCEPPEHSPELVSEFRFTPKQSEAMEMDIFQKWRECRGKSPAQAELCYLNKAKWLEMYGVDMHVVKGRDGLEYALGLTPTGILVFEGANKIGLFFWPKITRMDFKKSKLTLVVVEDDEQALIKMMSETLNLKTSTLSMPHDRFIQLIHAAKLMLTVSAILKPSVCFVIVLLQYACFGLMQALPVWNNFNFLTIASFSGRTEYQATRSGRLRRTSTFERRPSKRYPSRRHSTFKAHNPAKPMQISAHNNPDVHSYQVTSKTKYMHNIPPAQQHWHAANQGNMRPHSHDHKPSWKPSTSRDDSNNSSYVQEHNNKNLGEPQNMMYQDKLMTTL